MTSAISSLHTMGKPYHMLIPNHIAVNKKNEVKLILPFFMDYFNFPKLLINYQQVSWDIYYYFSTERLRTYFHGDECNYQDKHLLPGFVT